MSGIKDDSRYFQDVIFANGYSDVPPSPVDPAVYAQAFSPEYPDVRSLSDGFQKTVNANVSQKDDLAGHYSTPPELPKDQTDYKKILIYVVAGSIAFFIYNKYLKRN